ncbi:serine hydrolase [Bacteroidota bacterium]
MVVYKGKVLIAWGDIEANFKCHSMRKAFLSALYGIYVDKGIIDIQKTLDELGIDDLTPLTDIEKKATVEQLLQSRSGIYLPAMGDGASMIANKPKRGSHVPGEYYHYNNWGFNALGTIFQHETGKGIFDEFEINISNSLGMEDFSSENVEMRTADYTKHAYYFFRMSARDLARFGLLYQQKGMWNGERIISEDWIKESTRSYSNTEQGGYGYLWKTFPKSESSKYGFQSLANYDVYSITGIGVHMLAVVPELDLVFINRYDSDNSIPHYESMPVYKLLDLIIAAKTGDSVSDPRFIELTSKPFSNAPRPVTKPNAIELPSEVLDTYVGEYYFPPVILRITREGDHLQIIEADGSVFDNLYPETEKLFFYKVWDRKIEFVTNKKGEVTHYYLVTKDVKIKATKIE